MKVGEMEDSIRVKLNVKPDSKVCLFHARKDLLPQFMKGDLNLMIDWAEHDCDTILYWLQTKDDVKDIMTHLERQIKKTGRIWLVIPKKEIARERGFSLTWDEMQQKILANTNLVDNKTASIGDGEYGTQFVIRKEAREE